MFPRERFGVYDLGNLQKKIASWTGIITPIPDTSNRISAAGHWNEETEEGENSPQQTIFVVLGSMQTIWGIKVYPRRRPDTIFLHTPSIYIHIDMCTCVYV